jgi:AcrR family transcriptional regulator
MIVMKRRGAESDGRERLMDAALALFADRGYDGVAIHEIAEAAGMTRAAPYYHFQNKEDLFLATVSREMERTAAKLAAAVKDAPTFRAQLIAVIETFLMVQGSSVGQFIADVKQNLSPSSLKRFEACHRQTMAVLQGVFDDAHAAGEYGRVSPRVAFQFFFSLTVGYMDLARTNAEFIQPVDGCNPPTPDVMVDVFLSGI